MNDANYGEIDVISQTLVGLFPTIYSYFKVRKCMYDSNCNSLIESLGHQITHMNDFHKITFEEIANWLEISHCNLELQIERR